MKRMARRAVGIVFVALLAACGSTSASSGAGDSGASADGGNGPGCPTALPVQGAPCSVEGAQCSYGCEQASPGNAACALHAWQVTAKTSTDCQTSDGGAPPADAPFACGAATCGVNQYCVIPCCGGPAPQCASKDDAGACPPGFHSGTCNSPGGMNGDCVQDPCTPPAPYCVDDPKNATDCSTNGASRTLSCVCA